MSWNVQHHDHLTYLAHLQQVTGQGWEQRAALSHVARALTDWEARLGRGRPAPDREPRNNAERGDWTAVAVCRTAYDLLAETLAGVNLDDYSPANAQPIACAHEAVEEIVKAWRILLIDVDGLRDTGQLDSFAVCESVAEQSADVLTGVRNAVQARYR